MESEQLVEHLSETHGIAPSVAREVIGTEEAYLRGFHDGLHGRVDADDLEGHPLPLWRTLQFETESSSPR